MRRARARVLLIVLACVSGSGCGGGVFKPEYEYEEELYLSLDGSATINVYASVASLVALRGANLNPDPRARIDLDYVRAFFGAPEVPVAVSLSRRDGRRFVNVSVDVADVRELPRLAPFAWSAYRFDRRAEVVEFRQVVGPPVSEAAESDRLRASRSAESAGPVRDSGPASQHGFVGSHSDPTVAQAERTRHMPALDWTGEEIVAFRLHLPSEVVSHNASAETERGNILVWEQLLASRLAGTPLEIQVNLTPTSILARTLLLFGSTVLAAAAAFAGVIWWMSWKAI